MSSNLKTKKGTGKALKARTGRRRSKAAGETPGKGAGKGERRVGRTAREMARSQREISVAEFFTKNRHLLGFDNPRKALLTTVKEAVDNALDACEEAGILPEIRVDLSPAGEGRYTVSVQDNGPGIVKAQIPRIFGKLLYGSKFHRLKQSRGQQGIGISAAAMYGQMTTGRPCRITSRIGPRKKARYFEILIDTKTNTPEVLKEAEITWPFEHGTRVEIDLEGIFHKGRRSVEEYLSQVLVANPHLTIVYKPPGEEERVFERTTRDAPVQAIEIKPHPYGVELGLLIQMLKTTKSRNLKGFFQGEFSRVGPGAAEAIISAAKLKPKASPKRIARKEADALYRAIQTVRIPRPPTNCLSPIGEELMLAGLKRIVPDAEIYLSVSRSPAVYRGNPFLIEAAVAWGGAGRGEDHASEILRFANRVPLQYQLSACAITKGIIGTNWRNYGITQPRGSLPIGPLVIAVHIASAWVPFTSESKEAIASYPEILKEITLALQVCGRRIGRHLRKKARIADAEKKASYIRKYIPQLALALKEILSLSDSATKRTADDLARILEKSRKIA